MRRPFVVALVLLFLVPAAALAGKSRKELEAELQKARHTELFVRNLPAAEKAFARVVAEAGDDLKIRLFAEVGQARVKARLGRVDAGKYLEKAVAVLKAFKAKLPADVVAELEKQIAEVRTLLAGPTAPKDVLVRIQALIAEAKSKPAVRQDHEFRLAKFGALAVRPLAAELRGPDPDWVAFAADTLARIPGPESAAALARALRDPKVLFPVEVANHLGFGDLEAFRVGLAHADPRVRAATANSLSDHTGGDPSRSKLLLGALADRSPNVRSAALRVSSGKPLALEVTAKALTDPDAGVRKVAEMHAQFLEGSSVTPETAPLLLHLMKSEDPKVRMNALALAYGAGEGVCGKAIDLALEDRSVAIVERAVDLLSQAKVPVAGGHLDGLARAAATILSGPPSLNGAWAFHRIVGLLSGKLDPSHLDLLLPVVPLADAWTGPHRGGSNLYPFDELDGLMPDGKGSADFLVKAYAEIEKDDHRAEWLEDNASAMGKKVVPLAKAGVEKGGPALRAAALSILGKLLPAEKLPDVGRYLEDPSSSVRVAALVVLVKKEGAKAMATVAAVLEKDPDLIENFMDGAKPYLEPKEYDDLLRRLVGVSMVWSELWPGAFWRQVSDDTILFVLQHGSQSVADQAAPVAGRRHLLPAWPLLLSRSSGPDSAEAHAAAAIRHYYLSMKEYRDTAQAMGHDVVAKAKKLAVSKDPAQRTAAAYALAALGDRSAISVLLDLVADPDAGVREAALAALKHLALGGTEKKAPEKKVPAKKK